MGDLSNLYRVLRENSAVRKYKRNLSNRVGAIPLGEALKKIAKSGYEIGDAFVWSDTIEGHVFWRGLNDQLDALKNHRYNEFKPNTYSPCWVE